MSVAIIQEKLLEYNCKTIQEQNNALKEIAQDIALMVLSKTEFFKLAAFQGGTCLRILYGLNRFSEDLDFILKKPDSNFVWDKYIKNMQQEFEAYGYLLEIKDRSKLGNNIKSAFLKTNSLGGLLILKDINFMQTKLKIKLEIDTNPPLGSQYENKFLDFPLPYAITAQDKESLFASKTHAILCRKFDKGRDWYDFDWYVSKKIKINLDFLANAIEQYGMYSNSNLKINKKWLINKLKEKIICLDWGLLKSDVVRFIALDEHDRLNLWSKDYFISRLEKLNSYL